MSVGIQSSALSPTMGCDDLGYGATHRSWIESDNESRQVLLARVINVASEFDIIMITLLSLPSQYGDEVPQDRICTL